MATIENTIENNQDKFVQIRLWDDCINNCTFCSLQNRNRKTPVESKKSRLKQSADLVKTIKAEQIGLIGGEFFEGQLRGCEEEWEALLAELLKTDAKVFITANLIHEQYYLQDTVDLMGQRLLLCTSYDEVGRFHTDLAKANWLQRIEKLHSEGVYVFCTCIQTQDFLTSKTALPNWLFVNLCDPHLGVDWYINVDKNHYHDHLIEENKLFNLPERRTAVKWMRDHPSTTARYVAYDSTHSNTIYAFNENNELIKEFDDRLTSEACISPACGHPYFCMCYADSCKCMMCDAEKVIGGIS